MDLLLTHGYFIADDPKEMQIVKPYPPLGLLYLCSHLRNKHVDVEIYDSTFSTLPDLLRTLESTPPSILGVYANLMTRKNAVTIIGRAKALGWKVIAGGPEPGAYAQEYLESGADVVVFGEGENTLEELIPVLRSGSLLQLSNIAGIAYLENGEICRTPPREQIKDLDAQPWPARDMIDIHRYLNCWRKAHGVGSVSFITARGCPYQCQWCSHQVYGQTHRRRSPYRVADEVEWILNRYEPEMLWAADDVFTIHHGWLRDYTSEITRRGLSTPFECISRADRMNEESVDMLAQLGCFRIWIGSESGSQRLLDSMHRGVNVEQVRRAIELCRSRGIKTGMFLMWGYEDEDISDIEATIDHVKRSQPDVFLTTISYPIKGTPYFEKVKHRLIQTKAWAQSSDRELEIAGRHSRRFYEHADQLLRREVELARIQNDSGSDAVSLMAQVRSAREKLLATAGERSA